MTPNTNQIMFNRPTYIQVGLSYTRKMQKELQKFSISFASVTHAY
jgi:hypothetical protein